MKKTALTLLVMSAFTAHAHVPSECPNLSGTFVSNGGSETQSISVSQVANGVMYSFGDGSNPTIADGAPHAIDQGVVYIATCSKGVLKTDVSVNGQVVLSLSHSQINEKGDMRAVSTGTDESDTVWLKK